MNDTSRNYGAFPLLACTALLPEGVILVANRHTGQFVLYMGDEKLAEVHRDTTTRWRRKAEVMASVARRALLVKERGY